MAVSSLSGKFAVTSAPVLGLLGQGGDRHRETERPCIRDTTPGRPCQDQTATGAASRQEQAHEVVVDDFSFRPDGEVRGDEPLGARELAGAFGHLPYDGAPLDAAVSAGPEHTLPECLERH